MITMDKNQSKLYLKDYIVSLLVLDGNQPFEIF